MSAAAARALAPQTRKPNGYFKVPNAFVQNLDRLTPAEIAMALIVFKREQDYPEGAPLSDETWTLWTGLKPRMRDYAMKGLVEKGLKVVSGRGQQMKFQFDRVGFFEYLNRTQTIQGPKTKGRTVTKPVKAKQGAMLHPQCGSGGCALMHQTREEEAAENVQQVAQTTPVPAGKLHLVPLPVTPTAVRTKPPQPTVQNVQQVAHSPNAPEVVYAKTLAEVQRNFPWADGVFITNLVASCRATGLRSIHDEELAIAVKNAHTVRGRNQRVEGYYLFTVPPQLALIRKMPKVKEVPAETNDAADSALERAHGALVKYGLDSEAQAVAAIRQRWGKGKNLESVIDELCSLETAIATTITRKLSAETLKSVDANVERQSKPYSQGKMTDNQFADLRGKIRQREILTAAGIPQLGLLV